MTAITVASMLIMHWIAYFGPPNNLLSDNGTQFKSDIMRDVAAIMDTRLKFTPPYLTDLIWRVAYLTCGLCKAWMECEYDLTNNIR